MASTMATMSVTAGVAAVEGRLAAPAVGVQAARKTAVCSATRPKGASRASLSRTSFLGGEIKSASSTSASTSVHRPVPFSEKREGVRCEAAKPTVLVTEKLGDAGLDILKKHANVDCSYDLSPEELQAKISLCDALIIRSATKVTREVFAASHGRLKVVGRAGVGIDNVDLVAATEAGVLVVNAPSANITAAAEHSIAMLCCMARNIAEADASMKAGKWERSKFVGVSLEHKTLAVIGLGKIGSEVARRARGLGMHIVAHDPYAPADRARTLGVDLLPLEDALAVADFVTLHMPMTPTTKDLLSDAAFARCKKGVRVINVARGGVINEDALARAIEAGIVAQAALDVFTEEPPSKDNPLLKMPQVTVTPHLGASTIEAQEGVSVEVSQAVVDALNGEMAATAVNAPMVPSSVLVELAPYVTLAQKLGNMAVQLVDEGGLKDVRITYSTSRGDDLDTRLLRAMVIKGLLEPVTENPINLVNADYIAKQRGLRITEVIAQAGDLSSQPLSRMTLQLPGATAKFQGAVDKMDNAITLVGGVMDRSPFLFGLGNFAVDVSLEGSLLVYRQVDRPGMIGLVGGLLGEAKVNISYMTLSRTGPGQQAIVAVGVDDKVPASVITTLRNQGDINEIVFVDLSS